MTTSDLFDASVAATSAGHRDAHTDGEWTLVPCPRCGSTARRCKRPSGHEAAGWHMEREDALALLRRDTCPACAAWCESRGLTEGNAGGDA